MTRVGAEVVRMGLIAMAAAGCGGKGNPTTSSDLSTTASNDMSVGAASSQTFTLLTGVGAVFHWPGADSLVGTADDVVGMVASPMNGSGPNAANSYSFQGLDFGSGATDNGMPPGMNAITFLQGTVTADTGVAQNG